jgi:hypothetical protein
MQRTNRAAAAAAERAGLRLETKKFADSVTEWQWVAVTQTQNRKQFLL